MSKSKQDELETEETEPKKRKPDPLWDGTPRCPDHGQMLFQQRIEALVAGKLGYKLIGWCNFCPGDKANEGHAAGKLICNTGDVSAGFTQSIWNKMKRERHEWGRTKCYIEADGAILTYSEKYPRPRDRAEAPTTPTPEAVKIGNANQPEMPEIVDEAPIPEETEGECPF